MTPDPASADSLIREIAVKHGIAVGRNDPILVMATVIDLLSRNFSEMQANNQTKISQEFGEMVDRMSAEARQSLEKACNEVLAAIHKDMNNSVDAGIQRTIQALKTEAESGAATIRRASEFASRTLEQPLEQMRRSGNIIFFTALMTLIAAGAVAVTVLLR